MRNNDIRLFIAHINGFAKIENGESDSFLTYEDGVKDAILWVLNESKKPLDESK